MRISGIEAARITKRRLFDNGAFELMAYLALGVGLPPAIWFWRAPSMLLQPSGANSLIAITCAAVSTWFVLCRLRRYARVRRLSYILPVNLFTFGAAAAVVGTLRVDYSIVIFLFAFVSTTALSFLVTALSRHAPAAQLVVPGGKMHELSQVGADALYLTREVFDEFRRLGHVPASVVADLHHEHPPEIERLIADMALAGVPVYHYKSWLEARTGRVLVDHLSETNRGSLIPDLSYMIAKRVLDVISAIALLPILLPFFVLIAVAVGFETPGGAFFSQERIGFRGKRFRIYKFRTMRSRNIGSTAEDLRHDQMTRAEDDRITRVGSVLRRYRLDELPQVFNILKGDMSWIGPRPEAIALSSWYESRIPFYSYRHIVRPGLTGWAQVNQGHVTALDDINEKLQFDFYYIKNFSHWLDVLITLKTIRILLGGFGAK